MLKPTPSRSFLHVSTEINAVLGIQGHFEMLHMLKPTPSRSFLHVSNEINAVLGIEGHFEMFTYAKAYALKVILTCL